MINMVNYLIIFKLGYSYTYIYIYFFFFPFPAFFQLFNNLNVEHHRQLVDLALYKSVYYVLL